MTRSFVGFDDDFGQWDVIRCKSDAQFGWLPMMILVGGRVAQGYSFTLVMDDRREVLKMARLFVRV